ncbi:alpha/beta fold hydrolase [Tsukamurella paurometabola]|uniref:Acetoin dehydrogenase E2 subunit dihydrolipoyllysine-residue acetyltransferase n=1 Tax=Tsukamurella paurometabola TaxID=2061 RepID=A0A3P8L7E3_TSUPA|nr:alpha/beta hydrolase [Tsukamurella paurometabola]MBS4102661.1 alpha/beta hydrolase [Tsukamurella paurometabola]UEA82363.1 alpha/beta hydrolase [Tsukamurella paurometabola]VDR39411.1 acetoin dehydrogenase E2 subunit dihydrolipoyllysine-residue acetyltransferase [Tsukamurella paurometabola]
MNDDRGRIHIPARPPGPALLAGLGTGVAVAALTGIAAAARALGVRGAGEDPVSPDDLVFRADRESIVMSTDGVPLHVREVGPRSAPVTVLFVHGFTLRTASWVLVRNELRARWGDDVRMVFPDCRGHGDSGGCTPEQSTVALLGDDIATLLRALVPEGPVVLAGHSMGGMAICGFATGHPELVGTRVVGAALLGTASHALTDAGLAAALRNPVLDVVRTAIRFLPSVVGRGREVIKPIATPFVTAGAYAPGDRSATMTDFSSTMSLSAPLGTYAGFMPALEDYDERAALPVLRRIATSVVCGDHDWMTPLGKSAALAEELDSELIVLADTGHMLILESAPRVARAIADLVARVTR